MCNTEPLMMWVHKIHTMKSARCIDRKSVLNKCVGGYEHVMRHFRPPTMMKTGVASAEMKKSVHTIMDRKARRSLRPAWLYGGCQKMVASRKPVTSIRATRITYSDGVRAVTSAVRWSSTRSSRHRLLAYSGCCTTFSPPPAFTEADCLPVQSFTLPSVSPSTPNSTSAPMNGDVTFSSECTRDQLAENSSNSARLECWRGLDTVDVTAPTSILSPLTSSSSPLLSLICPCFCCSPCCCI